MLKKLTFSFIIPCLGILSLKADDTNKTSFFSSNTIPTEIVITLNEGDFIYPRISPDGGKLVFAEVLKAKEGEETKIWLLDLLTRKKSVLLSDGKARETKVFASFVNQLNWVDNNTLEIGISDGDVSTTIYHVSVKDFKILSETESQDDGRLNEKNKKALVQLQKLYPQIEPDVFESSFHLFPIVMPEKAVILQKNYEGHDHHVWWFDLTRSNSIPLVNLEKTNLYAFGGGVVVNDRAAFVVNIQSKAKLYIYKEGKAQSVNELATTQQTPRISNRVTNEKGVWFLLEAYPSHEKGNNGAFWFNGNNLFHYKDFPQLYDFDVNPSKRLIVFSYWQGDNRHLTLKTLTD